MIRILAILLLMPLVAAAPVKPSVGELEARTVFAEEGDLGGSLIAFDASGAEMEQSVEEFSLTAANVRLDVDHARVDHRAGSLGITPKEAWTESSEHDHVAVELQESRLDAGFFIKPLGQGAHVQMEAGSMSSSASRSEAQQYQWVTDLREPLNAATTRAVDITSPDAAKLRIEGDFVVALWDATIAFGEGEDQVVLHTGTEHEEMVGGALGIRGVEATHDREGYLFVTDGVLHLNLSRIPGETLHVAKPEVKDAGLVLIEQARGVLYRDDGPLAVEGDLELRGVDVLYGPTHGQTMEVSLHGEGSASLASGASVQLGAQESGPWLLWLAAASVVVFVALLWRRSQHPDRLHRRAVDLFEKERFERAERMLGRVVRRRPDADVYLERAEVRALLGKRADALADHEMAHGLRASRRLRVENAIQATIQAVGSDLDAAVKWARRGWHEDAFTMSRALAMLDELEALRPHLHRITVESGYA